MARKVALIPGDGIGPEITAAMRRVVDATGVEIEWNTVDAGAGVIEEYGTPLPQHVLDAVEDAKVAIKGPITTPVGTGFRSVNVALRKHFDLYSCVRPCLSQPGDGSRYEDVDLSSSVKTPKTCTRASSLTRGIPALRRSLASWRGLAARRFAPIPLFRSSRFPLPVRSALSSTRLSTPAAVVAAR